MDYTDDELLRNVARAYDKVQRAQAHCCGSTLTQCEILCAIGAEGVLAQAELGSRIGLEKSWVSRAVDSLQKEGLVERRKCCNDARMFDVAFTPEGFSRFNQLNESLNQQAAGIIERIPAAEQAGVRHSLRLLSKALTEVLEEGDPNCCGQAAEKEGVQ